MRKLLLSIVAMLLAALSANAAFAQANNASVGGVVQDTTKALIPGVTITLTNTDTGVIDTRLTNESGAYNFPSVPPGTYKISADLKGFRAAAQSNVQLGTAAQVRIDLTLQVGAAPGETVQVTLNNDNRIQESAASVGDVLSDERIHSLPLVGNNVLDLLSTLPGFRSGVSLAGGTGGGTVGGLSLDSVNATINGLETNSSRDSAGFWGYQTFTTTVVNPDLVGEIRLILAPVDAELGRGNAQVQIQTRSGTNKFTGSAVWNVQNTALNANTWLNNHTPTLINGVAVHNSTPLNWLNVNQITASYGGPIIKNKTFFFVLYDQQLVNGRTLVSNQVLTDTGLQGIYRYWSGWNPGNAAFVNPTTFTGSNTGTYQSVDVLGNPLAPPFNPDGSPYTGSLICMSVFGNIKANGTPFTAADCPNPTGVNQTVVIQPAWDPNRPNMDTTGYLQKVLALAPHANNFTVLGPGNVQVGDGLNTAANRYLQGRKGSGGVNASIGVVSSSADYNGRKQLNTKVDHNLNKNNRLSFGWTYEVDSGVASQAAWQGGLDGATKRVPQVLTVNGTSTINANLVNEARFGVNYSSEWDSPAWSNPLSSKTTQAASQYLLQGSTNPVNGKVYPVIFNPGTNANGFMNFGAFDFANDSPLWDYSDTVRWSHGKHAFSFGGEYRRPETTGFNNSAYSAASVGNPAAALSTVPQLATLGNSAALLPGFNQTARNSEVALNEQLAGSLATASTSYWIDGYANLQNATWIDTTTESSKNTVSTATPDYGHQSRTQIQNQWSFFAKDDYKITKSLTLNLGIRYDLNMSPYMGFGLTNRFAGDGIGLYGAGRPVSGDLLANWMQPGALYLTGYGSSSTLSCQAGLQQNSSLPVSTCDPSLQSAVDFVGPGTPNPKEKLIPQNGQFSPALGFAWQLPFFGEGKTTMRGGFQRTYGGAGSTFSGGLLSGPGGDASGGAINVNDPRVAAILATRALNLNDLTTLIPAAPTRNPGATIPIAGRSVGISYSMYASDYVTPYTDNFTLSITRNVSNKLTVDVRFVDTLGKKLPGTLGGGVGAAGSFDLNTVNVYHNPELLNALNVTRAGGNDPLFDSMLIGLNLNSGVAGYGAVGTCGTTGVPEGPGGCPAGQVLQRGSAQIRRAFASSLANGNYVNVLNGVAFVSAGLLTTAPTAAQGAQPLPTINDPTTGLPENPAQRVLRNGCDRIADGLTSGFLLPDGTNALPRCFPENYIITNPQLSTANYAGNYGHSNYQSGQLQFTIRPIQGVSFQGTYSLSKTMGLSGSGFTDPLNRQLDYGAMSSSQGQDFRTNGTFELPIGPNKIILGNSSGWLARFVERWQTSIIYDLPQGSLRSIVGNNMLYANGRPNVVGPWNDPKGSVSWDGGPSGSYFGSPSPYLSYKDPQCTSNVAGVDGNGFNLQSSCTLVGLGQVVSASTPGAVLAANGTSFVLPLLANPLPGEQGDLGLNTMHTVSNWTLNATISKNFRITESKALQLRVDTTNVLNHPTPGDPIGVGGQAIGTNSLQDGFGQITTKTGSRTFQGSLRLTF